VKNQSPPAGVAGKLGRPGVTGTNTYSSPFGQVPVVSSYLEQ